MAEGLLSFLSFLVNHEKSRPKYIADTFLYVFAMINMILKEAYWILWSCTKEIDSAKVSDVQDSIQR